MLAALVLSAFTMVMMVLFRKMFPLPFLSMSLASVKKCFQAVLVFEVSRAAVMRVIGRLWIASDLADE